MDPTDMLDKVGASARPGPALRVLAIAAGIMELNSGTPADGVYALRSDNRVFHFGNCQWRELPPVPGVSDAPAPLPTFDWLAGDRPDPPRIRGRVASVELLSGAALSIPDPDDVLPALVRMDDESRNKVFLSVGLVTPEYLELVGDDENAAQEITGRALYHAMRDGKLPQLARAVAEALAAK